MAQLSDIREGPMTPDGFCIHKTGVKVGQT